MPFFCCHRHINYPSTAIFNKKCAMLLGEIRAYGGGAGVIRAYRFGTCAICAKYGDVFSESLPLRQNAPGSNGVSLGQKQIFNRQPGQGDGRGRRPCRPRLDAVLGGLPFFKGLLLSRQPFLTQRTCLYLRQGKRGQVPARPQAGLFHTAWRPLLPYKVRGPPPCLKKREGVVFCRIIIAVYEVKPVILVFCYCCA